MLVPLSEIRPSTKFYQIKVRRKLSISTLVICKNKTIAETIAFYKTLLKQFIRQLVYRFENAVCQKSVKM